MQQIVSVSQDLYHKEKRFQWEAKISVPGQRKKVVSNHNGTTTLVLISISVPHCQVKERQWIIDHMATDIRNLSKLIAPIAEKYGVERVVPFRFQGQRRLF